MGTLFLILGLLALLVSLFRHAAGIALVGSVLSLTVAFVATVFMSHSGLPEAVGLLYVAIAVALWASSPPADELAEPLGDEPTQQRAQQNPALRSGDSIDSVDPVTGDSLAPADHLWLVGLPVVGFLVTFAALPTRTGLLDGIWGAAISGTPGAGLAWGVTDISALFGLALVFPGGPLVLTLPVTGVVALGVQLARGRPTAFTASMEYLATTVIMNLIALFTFPLY